MINRDAAAAHEAAQYNMGLPPSLVQAAASNKTGLHHQALANLNMREAAASSSTTSSTSRAADFLTPPQTPVSSLAWKGANAASLVVPEPHKPDPRALVNNVMRGMERHYDLNGGAAGGGAPSPVNNGASTSSSSNRGGMRQAVELKSSQPIFPGQPPPLSRSAAEKTFNAQPPPRQSSQVCYCNVLLTLKRIYVHCFIVLRFRHVRLRLLPTGLLFPAKLRRRHSSNSSNNNSRPSSPVRSTTTTRAPRMWRARNRSISKIRVRNNSSSFTSNKNRDRAAVATAADQIGLRKSINISSN